MRSLNSAMCSSPLGCEDTPDVQLLASARDVRVGGLMSSGALLRTFLDSLHRLRARRNFKSVDARLHLASPVEIVHHHLGLVVQDIPTKLATNLNVGCCLEDPDSVD